MTRCRSTTSVQLGQRQSRHLHSFLCPFRLDTTPWFRHRAHFGVRSDRLDTMTDSHLVANFRSEIALRNNIDND